MVFGVSALLVLGASLCLAFWTIPQWRFASDSEPVPQKLLEKVDFSKLTEENVTANGFSIWGSQSEDDRAVYEDNTTEGVRYYAEVAFASPEDADGDLPNAHYRHHYEDFTHVAMKLADLGENGVVYRVELLHKNGAELLLDGTFADTEQAHYAEMYAYLDALLDKLA